MAETNSNNLENSTLSPIDAELEVKVGNVRAAALSGGDSDGNGKDKVGFVSEDALSGGDSDNSGEDESASDADSCAEDSNGNGKDEAASDKECDTEDSDVSESDFKVLAKGKVEVRDLKKLATVSDRPSIESFDTRMSGELQQMNVERTSESLDRRLARWVSALTTEEKAEALFRGPKTQYTFGPEKREVTEGEMLNDFSYLSRVHNIGGLLKHELLQEVALLGMKYIHAIFMEEFNCQIYGAPLTPKDLLPTAFDHVNCMGQLPDFPEEREEEDTIEYFLEVNPLKKTITKRSLEHLKQTEKEVVVQLDDTDGSEQETAKVNQSEGSDDEERQKTAKISRREKVKSVDRRCPIGDCSYYGPRLKRHLPAMHPDQCPDKQTVEFFVAKASGKISDSTKKGKGKAKPLFQCSIADCGKIVQRKADHLKRVHNIWGKERTRLSLAMKRVNGAQADLKIRKAKKPARSEEEEKRLANKKRSRKSSSESSDEEEERWAKKRKITKLVEEKKSRELISESSDEDEERLAKGRKLSQSPSKDDEAGSPSERSSEEEEAGTQAPVRMERTWIEYYGKWEERKTSVREHYMAGFFKYLGSPYGGKMSAKNAVEHVRHVHIMLNIIDSNGDDLDCLVKKKGIYISDKFVDPHLEGKKLSGGTLKSYLESVRLFSNFVQHGLVVEQPFKVSKKMRGKFERLPKWLDNFKKTIHRSTTTETTTRIVEEAMTALTDEDINVFYDCQRTRRAITILGEASGGDVVIGDLEFTLVRDYLICRLIIENGSRPGPFENMRVDRFENAVQNPDNGDYMIVVDEQKTSRHHGPAEISMDKSMYSYMKIYNENIRPSFCKNQEYLFTTDEGRRFEKGTIGKRLSMYFKTAGIRKDISVCATRVRKYHATRAFRMSPTKKRLVNRHMKHSERTADTNYALSMQVKNSSEARRQMIRGFKQVKEDANMAKLQEKSSSSTMTKLNAALNPMEEEEDQVNKSKQTKLSAGDKIVINAIFREEIRTGKPVYVADIQKKSESHDYLKQVVDRGDGKAVYHYVRRETKTHAETSIENLPEEDQSLRTSDYVAGTLTSSSQIRSKRAWPGHETSAIEARFSAYDKMPSKKEIIEVFEEHEVLKYVLESQGTDRCYEKVKTIFKQRAKQRKQEEH